MEDWDELGAGGSRRPVTASGLPSPATAPVDILFWISAKTFPDVRVRQALAYAIDREKVREVVFGGRADIGQGPVHTAQQLHAQLAGNRLRDPQLRPARGHRVAGCDLRRG